MKIFKKLFRRSSKELDILKIVFGYISNEIIITVFLSDKSNQIFENNSIINSKNINDLLLRLKEIKEIDNINISPTYKINDKPLIKIIKIIIKHK